MESKFTVTGISGLDRILGGGLCEGNITLVEGGSGTGKTTLAVEFIVNGAVKFQEPGIIVILEEHLEKLRQDMLKFGWDLQALENENKIRLFGLSPHNFVEMLKKEDSPILKSVRKMKARRICVDSLTLLVEETQAPRKQRQLFSTLINALRRERLTSMLVIELPSKSLADQYVIERSVVDSVFRMSIEPSPVGQGQVFRRFEVVKSRGQSFNEGLHALRIGYSSIFDSHGVHIFPRFKSTIALLADVPKESNRMRFGIRKLDDLLCGGVYAGSATMIAGPSGTGKSLLGMQFILEGLKQGQPVLMVSMEESMPQILMNSRTLGVDLKSPIQEGRMTVKLASPLEMDMDEHIYEITKLIEERNIKRLLIDSISAYEIAMQADPARYKDYVYAFLMYLKSRSVTHLVTSEISDLAESSRITDKGTSFIVDNIIMLKYAEIKHKLRKLIYVLKSRGSDHRECVQEYVVRSNGVDLIELDPDEVYSVSVLGKSSPIGNHEKNG